MFISILMKIYNKVYFSIARLRGFFWCLILKKSGHHIYLSSNFTPNSPMNITIGSYISINKNVVLDGSGILSIGNYVMIGPDTKIYSSNHDFNNKSNMMISKKIIKKPVLIGSNVWIGANVIILPGISIMDGTVIGAGSIVTKSVIKKNTIVAGNPAVFIRKRI